MAVTWSPEYPVVGEEVTVTVTDSDGNEFIYEFEAKPQQSELATSFLRVASQNTINNSSNNVAEGSLGISTFTPDAKGEYSIVAYEFMNVRGVKSYDRHPAGEQRRRLLGTQTGTIHIGDYVYLPISTSHDGVKIKLQINNDTIRGAWLSDPTTEAARVASTTSAVESALSALIGETVDSIGDELRVVVNDLRANYNAHLDMTFDDPRDCVKVYTYDASATPTYDDVTDEAGSEVIGDINLLPSAGAIQAGDAIYIATDGAMDTIKVDVSTAGSGSWVITYKYYNGGWSNLASVSDGTNGFKTFGTNSITYTKPSDAEKTTINGSGPYYWIKAEVTTGDASPTTRPLGTTIKFYASTHSEPLDDLNYASYTNAESNEAAISLINNIREKISSHVLKETWHGADDSKNVPLAQVAKSLETATVLAADLRERVFERHRVQTAEPPTHGGEDVTNILTAPTLLDNVIVTYLDELAKAYATSPSGESDGIVLAGSKFGFRSG